MRSFAQPSKFLRTLLRACVCLLLTATFAVAANPRATTYQFDIPAQSLGDALQAVALASQHKLFYDTVLVKGKNSAALKGEFTTEEAVQRLLAGTELGYELTSDGLVLIRPKGVSSSDNRFPAEALRLAEAEERNAPKHGVPESFDANKDQSHEITVTGSRLNRAETEGPQRVNVYSSEEIERSGQATIGRFLSTLPEVFNNQSGESTFQGFSNAPTVQLRGFPMGSTLVLVNGRRLGNTTTTYGSHFNLNNIPAAAVERIEVLPEGASAVYGSDAIAGVVNIILKRDLSGVQLDATYGAASGTHEQSASLAWGKTWDRTRLSVVASYQDKSPLSASDRSITADADYRRFGGPDRRVTTCESGNVYSVSGANLPGLSSSFAAVPAGAQRPTLADFAATAGQLNRCSDIYGTLTPQRQMAGALVNFSTRWSETLEFFSTLVYTDVEDHSKVASLTVSKIRVPASNPFNPFGQEVLVDFAFPRDWNNSKYNYDSQYVQPLVGLRGVLGSSWDWEAAAWLSREDNAQRSIGSVTTAPLSGLLANTSAAQSINIFGAGTAVVPQELQGQVFSVYNADYVSDIKAGSAVARGPLFNLPAGSVDVAVGLDVTEERIAAEYPDVPFSYSRRLKAGYLEARVPLLGNEGRDLLGLTGAVRRDDYSDFGSATTSQFGLEWRPRRSLLVRAAFAESFVAPQLYFYNFPPYPFVSPLFDPVRNETVNATYIFGGNTSLKAQQGESWSLGLVWNSEAVADLQGSLSLWRLDLSDRLNPFPSPSFLVRNESLFPDRVIRAPASGGTPGQVLTVDYRAMNLGELNVSGVDGDLGYAFGFGGGRLNTGVRATWIGQYEVVLLPGQAPLDYVAQSSNDVWAPRLRLTATLGWEKGPLSSSLSGRYVSSFKDRAPLPSGQVKTLGDVWVWDASVVMNLGEVLGSQQKYFQDTRISLGAVNLLDQSVPFSMANEGGYEPSVYDIRGRYVYLSVGTRW